MWKHNSCRLALKLESQSTNHTLKGSQVILLETTKLSWAHMLADRWKKSRDTDLLQERLKLQLLASLSGEILSFCLFCAAGLNVFVLSIPTIISNCFNETGKKAVTKTTWTHKMKLDQKHRRSTTINVNMHQSKLQCDYCWEWFYCKRRERICVLRQTCGDLSLFPV